MVQEVVRFTIILKILDYRSIVDIPLQILDVVFYVFGFVCNWEIEGVVAQAEAEGVQSVVHTNLALEILIDLKDEAVWGIGRERDCSRCLSCLLFTLGKLMMPTILHWYPCLMCCMSFSLQAYLFWAALNTSPAFNPLGTSQRVSLSWRLLYTYQSSSWNWMVKTEYQRKYLRREFCRR